MRDDCVRISSDVTLLGFAQVWPLNQRAAHRAGCVFFFSNHVIPKIRIFLRRAKLAFISVIEISLLVENTDISIVNRDMSIVNRDISINNIYLYFVLIEIFLLGIEIYYRNKC